MNIALVFPKSTFLIDPMVYPPLGLFYLAAQLELKGHRTEFFDLSEDDLPADGEFDQVWVSATAPQLHEVRRIGEVVRGWRRTATVLGGALPWASPHRCNDLGFDLVVSGEADEPEITQHVVMYANTNRRDHDVSRFIPPPVTGVSHILPPIRRWTDRYHAFLEDRKGELHPTTTLFTSRGCPMACAFCESGRNGVIWSKHVRYEPVPLVELQLKEIVKMGFTGAMFYDDILPLNKPRTLEILDLLKRYGLIWRCFLRTDVIMKQGGREYLKEMADSGLVEVLAGVESADNRIKEAITKGTTIEQDTQVLKWCKELGIKFKASLILGLPGEDRASMEKTRDWILTNRPDRVDVNTLIPFPGTPMVTHADQYDVYWTENVPESYWYKGPREESNALVGTSHLKPEEIEAFRNELIREIEAAGIPY